MRLSVQEKKKIKINFQNGGCGGHLVFPIGMSLTIFIFKSSRYFTSSFESIDYSVQEKTFVIGFQDGHLGIPIGTILVTFDQQVTPILPTIGFSVQE